jgi:hypothetical protein
LTKPGWQTSEFWLHLLVGVAIVGLTEFGKIADVAGLPPWVSGAYHLISPIALAWLAKSYQAHRSEVKRTDSYMTAQVEAQKAATGVYGIINSQQGPNQ